MRPRRKRKIRSGGKVRKIARCAGIAYLMAPYIWLIQKLPRPVV
jgi:hypothetical protein